MKNSDILLTPGDKCLLYGAGKIGRETAEVLIKIGINVIAFIDSQKEGEYLHIPILKLSNIPEYFRDLPVIITIFSFPKNCSLSLITDDLHSAGFRFIQSFESFYFRYYDYFTDTHYWLCDPLLIKKHEKELLAFEYMLADDYSKQILHSQIRFRLTGSVSDLIEPSPVELQYFDYTVFKRKNFNEFWDIGAFTGDTLENAIQQKMIFNKVIEFEPDLHNYQRCCQYLHSHINYYPNAKALPIAAGSTNEILKFNNDASLSSAISCAGNVEIPSISLDSAFIGATPDFIKMDIEGSELSALKGMQNIIVKNQPLLAISIYHRPEDIYEIPLYLKNILNDYKYYIRCYGEHCFDSVLYAVPDHIY